MSHRNWTGFSLSALGAAVAIVAAAPAMAQNTTAGVAGRITMADGKPAAGATVTIVHRESGSTNNLVTDADGRYSVRGLRVGGPYDVTVAKGSDRKIRNDVYLTLAETLALDVALGSQQLDTVVVAGTANSKFGESVMGAGTQLTRKELDAYASIGRNLQDYARMDPRLAQTDKDRGEISAAGQNSRFNSITVDGVAISDTFGLEANTLPTIKQPISIDAIQSVQVNLSNYDVTQKAYTGANINAVTKSGTNEFKGSLYYVYRNDKLVGSKYNRASDTYFNVLPYKEDTKGVTLGGPIIKDKLFFFASYEELKSNRVQPEFGPLGSPLTNVAITPAAIAGLQAAAKSKYGADVGEIGTTAPVSVKDKLIKIDWNISEHHRANVRYSSTQQDETIFGSFSATNLTMTSGWRVQQKKIDTTVAQWFADWTPNFSTELKVSNRDYVSLPANYSNSPSMSLQYTGAAPAGTPSGVSTSSRFLNFGTDFSYQHNALDTKTLDAYFGATLVQDDHEIKFGADLTRNKSFDTFYQGTNGSYTFSCQNSYTYDTIPGVTAGTLSGSAGRPSCTTITPAQLEAAVLENFVKGRPSSYSVQVLAPGRSWSEADARWSLQNRGLFVQDTWTVSNHLNITAGLRLDSLATNDRPFMNSAVAVATTAGSVNGEAIVRNTGGFGVDNTVNADGKKLWQPRIGFNWNLDTADKKKTQIRGGIGLFQGAAMNVWLNNPYQNTGVFTRTYGCGGSFTACPTTGIATSLDPNNQPINFSNATPAASVDLLDPGFKQPSVWKSNLALDKELPGGYVVGLEWMRTDVESGLYYKNLNLGAPTRIGPDGREMYYTPFAYLGQCWSSTGSLNTSGIVRTGVTCGSGAGLRTKALSNVDYTNVLMATNTKKGGGNTVTLSLQGPTIAGLGWQVAYTRSSAKEVSPLNGSTAGTNYNARAVFNPNEEVLANSAYVVRDRISAAINYSAAFVDKYKTSFGLFYEGRKGKPYSWTYRNDMNGDGISANDLMYIPTAFGSGEVVFLGDTATNKTQETLFWSIVDANKGLRDFKGKVTTRSSSLSPFVNNFDLRVSQELPGLFAKNKGVLTFDILNVGNLINPRWGRINEGAYSSSGAQKRTFVNFAGMDASGKYIYQVNQPDDLTLKQLKGESQWAMQITARYEF